MDRQEYLKVQQFCLICKIVSAKIPISANPHSWICTPVQNSVPNSNQLILSSEPLASLPLTSQRVRSFLAVVDYGSLLWFQLALLTSPPWCFIMWLLWPYMLFRLWCCLLTLLKIFFLVSDFHLYTNSHVLCFWHSQQCWGFISFYSKPVQHRWQV